MNQHFPYDLHVHSNWSDGDYAPERVFKEASKADLKGIVLTEHDVTKGLGGTYQKIAQRFNIETLEGVEISTKYKSMEVHILGYSQRFDLKVLNQGLQKTLEGMKQRAETMLTKLRAMGVTELYYSDIAGKLPKGIVVMKYHISNAIAKERNIPITEVSKLMHGGGAAYVPVGTANWAMSPQQAVSLITQANGIASLAHPGNYRGFNDLAPDRMEVLIDELIPILASQGLKGLEVMSAKHTPSQLKNYSAIAEKYKLIKTGGSDWHGYLKSPDRNLGDGGVIEEEFKKILSRTKKG